LILYVIGSDIKVKFICADIASGTGIMLAVNNPFSKPIRYNLGLMFLTSGRLYKTSSCPVIAKGGSYEYWPHPIFQLVVTNMHFLTEGDEMGCKE
jgi:hypothetical protein